MIDLNLCAPTCRIGGCHIRIAVQHTVGKHSLCHLPMFLSWRSKLGSFFCHEQSTRASCRYWLKKGLEEFRWRGSNVLRKQADDAAVRANLNCGRLTLKLYVCLGVSPWSRVAFRHPSCCWLAGWPGKAG